MDKKEISSFIKKHIIYREESMFSSDLEKNKVFLSQEIHNKSVLVIGGAGTIGSSFIKSLLKFKPKKLVVVDTNENGLTELTRDLRSTPNLKIPSSFLTYPMNFGEKSFFKMLDSTSRFDIVANFAAHKHVRSEKDQYSIQAMITNNVLNAKKLLDKLLEKKPNHFFCVSTDKASNPINVMGASKQLMEQVIMSYSDDFKITTARFANVAFSNGSLLDGYLNRIYKKQPISCPTNIRRYFVSPEESGQICLLACVLGKSREIFFPKLSKDSLKNFRKITFDFFNYIGKDIIQFDSDLDAKKYSINMHMNDPFPVVFFKSDTSGEKLYEEFFSSNDILNNEKYINLGIIENIQKQSKSYTNKVCFEFEKFFDNDQIEKSSFLDLMNIFVPNFNYKEKGKNLDEKM